LASITSGFPGIHGVEVAGIQGIGVSTPKAADVADATTGLASDWHIPKGRIFTIGLKSMIEAIGMLLNKIRLSGNTIKVDGARPIEHCNIAPAQTYIAMVFYI